jgi:hypothetical protein
MFRRQFSNMMWPALFAFNHAPEGDGGAAGGAAGGTEGEEKPLTRKDVEDMIGKQIGTHINSRGFQEKLRKGLATSDDVGGIKAILEELRAAKKPGEGAADDDAVDGKGKALDPEVVKTMSKLEERLTASEKKAKASEEENLAIKESQARAQERDALKTALQGKVRPALLPAAVALLYGEQKKVRRDKDGGIVFEVKRKDYTDELTVEEGVLEWLATPEGKEYLPPVGAGGTGDKSGAKDGGGKGTVLDKLSTGTADERTNAALNVIALG